MVRHGSLAFALLALSTVHCAKRVPVAREEHTPAVVQCGDTLPMRVHFYNVGQGLAALVELPTGQLLLVDSGESPTRPGCGNACRGWHEHFMNRLSADVGSKTIDLHWVTHPHSDHMGGSKAVLETHKVRSYADNGSLRRNAGVKRLLETAAEYGVPVLVAARDTPQSRLATNAALQVRGVMPNNWSVDCEKKPNDCSSGLRIDYCESSVLFVGDAEREEESLLSVEQVDLLQVGHHGSNTSSSEEFLAKARPQWAVISSGERGEGTNAGYCHPRATTVQALSATLGDTAGSPVEAFSGASCKSGTDSEWQQVPASTRLFVTARDGDVTFITTGDGAFRRE